jgi:hypothetical protein
MTNDNKLLQSWGIGDSAVINSSGLSACRRVGVVSKGGNGTCGKVKNPAELRITREWRQKFLLQLSLDF